MQLLLRAVRQKLLPEQVTLAQWICANARIMAKLSYLKVTSNILWSSEIMPKPAISGVSWSTIMSIVRSNVQRGASGVMMMYIWRHFTYGLMRILVHSLLIARHCDLRNWDQISVRAVRGVIYRAGMVSICLLL